MLQGETGASKSTLALQIAHHNLKLGNPVLMIDKENGEGRIRSRLICQRFGVSETDIKTVPEEKLREWAREIARYPLYIYTESVKSFEEVEERLKEMGEQHPDRPSILMIDSLQAMNAIDEDQRVSLEKWMYKFDEWKVQADGKLTIIVTSEKNRASYGNSDVGGAKGSNSVEYKAESLLDIRLSNDGNIIVKVAKARDGLRGQEFVLEKKFSEPSNPNSFTFTLGTSEVGDL